VVPLGATPWRHPIAAAKASELADEAAGGRDPVGLDARSVLQLVAVEPRVETGMIRRAAPRRPGSGDAHLSGAGPGMMWASSAITDSGSRVSRSRRLPSRFSASCRMVPGSAAGQKPEVGLVFVSPGAHVPVRQLTTRSPPGRR
jgi:hypothetical protein